MASNYADAFPSETVDENESDGVEYRPCKRCRGLGVVEVHDQETDCLDCEGYGEVPIPL